jgi:hypothetical protein
VSRVRRSVRPIFAMSSPSTTIRPSVASTKRKNESASVLFPEPIFDGHLNERSDSSSLCEYLFCREYRYETLSHLKARESNNTFSPGLTSNVRLWSMSGSSGWFGSEKHVQDVQGMSHGVADNKVLAFDGAMLRP